MATDVENVPIGVGAVYKHFGHYQLYPLQALSTNRSIGNKSGEFLTS